MQKLLSLIRIVSGSVAFLPTIFAIPLVQNGTLEERLVQSFFRFASIGDSWAAGPGIIARDAYQGKWDGSTTGCFLHKAAWEPLMAGDNSWTDDPIHFDFAACSGARLENANSQIGNVASPQLLTMQLGGNNAHFTDIATSCIYWGDGHDYPDPAGSCAQRISQWEAYLDADKGLGETKSFYFDHHLALTGIMNSTLIKGRDDFYLYIVGYAQFFNISPGSDWCNTETFGYKVKGISTAPKLNNAIRSKLNDLVTKINTVIAKSTSDMANPNIKFLDPSPFFENHRFCEPNHNINNQYFLNDVWFWNISPPEDDPNYLTASNAVQSAWALNNTFINGTTASQNQFLSLLGMSPGADPYSLGRTFHPKDGGHYAIKDSLIALLRADKVPGVKQAPAPPAPPTKQPYASGQAHIHINEFWSCLDSSDNLSVEITMWDSTSAQIGYIKRTQAGANGPAKMTSRLENPLIVTPEWANGGYIQFQLGDLGWTTGDTKQKNPNAYCNPPGGWDPRAGPQCWTDANPAPPIYNPDAVSKQQFDCFFNAPAWKGGNPSDGAPA